MDVWSIGRIETEIQHLQFYEDREADNLAAWIWEELLGFRKGSEAALNLFQIEKIKAAIIRLSLGEPIQYIVGHAFFYGVKLNVSPAVLIPRPETEELVDWVITDLKNGSKADIRILDIGTGSGCISLALKIKLQQKVNVTAIDISEEALKVAEQNAKENHVDIEFRRHDFLKDDPGGLGSFDIIISNPPYIDPTFKPDGKVNGLKFEPQISLYAQGDDPDVFYKRMAGYHQNLLRSGGWVYIEMNEFRSDSIYNEFLQCGWTEVEMCKDMQGKVRMLKAKKPH